MIYDRISSLTSKVNANVAEIEGLERSNRKLRQPIIDLESQCDQLKEENRNLKQALAEARNYFMNKSSLGLGMVSERLLVMNKLNKHQLNPLMNPPKSDTPTTDSSGLLTNEDDQSRNGIDGYFDNVI